MRRLVLAALLAMVAGIPVLSSHGVLPGYAQTAGPLQGDEFNSSSFNAPFQVRCGLYAVGTCPDPQGPNTWSLNGERLGFLRINSQFGSLVGTANAASNNARNFVVQPVNPAADYVATTSLTFPGGSFGNVNLLGQTAGVIVYQNDDNFLYVGRVLSSTGQSQIEFLQEENGVDLVNRVTESGFFQPTVYLRIIKTGNLYGAAYSYDNRNFTAVGPGIPATAVPTPPTATATATAATDTPTATATGTLTPTNTPTATATSTPGPIGYTPTAYTAPQVGVFAWGGTNAAVVNSTVPADFDWFRTTANSLTPAPSATPTFTTTPATATTTSTPTLAPTGTATTVPTSTATPVPTSTPTNTATPVPTATSTSIPTDTPTPTPRKKPFGFKYASIWYHYINIGHMQHVQIQTRSHGKYGIWTVVRFAGGKQIHFYAETDSKGFWATDFTIPPGTISPASPEAVVTFQLWKGSHTTKTFGTFTVLK